MSMKSTEVVGGYFVVLAKGEKLIKTLTSFCDARGIQAGSLNGIGAVQNTTLGYYRLGDKQYKFKKLNRLLEVVSLTGNVSINKGKVFLHIHAVLSDSKLRTYGGHLNEAKVGGTLEVFVQQFNEKFERRPDSDTGLSLIQ